VASEGFVRVGRIGKPHGVRGGVTVVHEGDAGGFAPGAVLTTSAGAELSIRSASRYRDRGLIVFFEGVETRDDAERLRGEILSVPASARRPLADGEFWEGDLVGLTAVAPDGTTLGMVTGVDPGVGQDRLVVTTPSGVEVLVPFVAAIVSDPDAEGRMEIRDPGGLFDP
jgi:16S rRNA processing protein RimM